MELVVPVEPESDFAPSEINVEKLDYFDAAQDYLKENYSESYIEWSKVKDLVQQYNLEAAAVIAYLEGAVRTRMNSAYPMLTEENLPTPRVKMNYYHLSDLVGVFYDALIDEQMDGLRAKFPGEEEAPILNAQSQTDNNGKCLIWIPEGPTLIETDKEEYYHTELLTRTLRPISVEPVLKRYFESLSQMDRKIRFLLVNFSKNLQPIIEKIGLGDV